MLKSYSHSRNCDDVEYPLQIETECRGPILRTIAYICSKVNDGLTESEISDYFGSRDKYDREFISFCVDFAVENNWLIKPAIGNRYSLTDTGRAFLSSQFGWN